MSIKYKLPVLLILAFFLNIFLLLGYYQFYLERRVELFQDKTSQFVLDTRNEVVTHIEGKAFEDAKKYIQSLNNERNLTITLQNEKNQVEIGDSNHDNVGFTATTLVQLSDGNYLLKVEKTVDFLNLKAHNIIIYLLVFEICVVFCIFVLLSIVIYFSYVRKLIGLDNLMRRYKSGDKINIKVSGEDEIGQLQLSFLRLVESIREEKQKQNRMIASISHDLKTPLTSVLGYSERVWKKELSKDKQKLYISIIYKQAKDIEAIVEEFEDYLGAAVLDRKQQQIYQISYLYQMLIDEYVNLFQEQNGSLNVHNQCQENVAVEVELLKIRRVFANIFGNSIRHSKSDSVNVHVEISEKDSNVIFSIIDNGVGVPKEDLPHLFEPFFTSDKSRQISGLGLSICKQIMEGHDGDIMAQQNMDGGLTIVFSLPKHQM